MRVESRKSRHGGQAKVESTWASLSETRTARRQVTLQLSFPRLGETRPRDAITLTEVLISLGILTLGLLGVAAMFPVGGYYMQKGDIADRSSAIAQAAFNDIVAQGLLDPRRWYIMLPYTLNSPPAGTPNDQFSVDPPSAFLPSTYFRQFAAALNEAQALTTDQGLISKQLGSAYVLDPMGVASYAILQPSVNNRWGYSFPATANYTSIPASVYSAYSGGTWNPWWSWKNAGTGVSSEDTWPIRRVTFHQASQLAITGYHEPVRVATAEALFSTHDDLSLDLPNRGDAPSSQNWDVRQDSPSNNWVPLARQSRGDYSWIVTVVPTTTAARNALATGGGGHAYDVSVVVFYKRALNRVDPIDQASSGEAGEFLMEQERAVRAQIVSTGPAGGELLLTAYDGTMSADDYPASSPFQNLKVGQWIMLCGPHPQSTADLPRFVLNWYRVLAIDGKDTQLDASGKPNDPPLANQPERRLVTVRGPRWPWLPDPNGNPYSSILSNYLCVGICPGAVAVHNRTIQLETSTPWSIE